MTQCGGCIGDYSGSQTGRTVHVGENMGITTTGPVPHMHSEYVEGCFRCDLSRDEVTDAS